jgi:hypothetical protein
MFKGPFGDFKTNLLSRNTLDTQDQMCYPEEWCEALRYSSVRCPAVGGGGALVLLSWSTVEPVTTPLFFIGYCVLTNYLRLKPTFRKGIQS